MGLSRRDVLMGLTALGGYRAAVGTLGAYGLSSPMAYAAEDQLTIAANAAGHLNKTAIVIGAGIGGLVTAYELEKAGFSVTVLEARERVGGRNWTLRSGDQVNYTDGTRQTVAFDAGHYFNAGAGRIPSHHQFLLGYCRELGVAIEPVVNTCRNGLLKPDLTKPAVQIRQVVNDARGYIAQYLSAAITRQQVPELAVADRPLFLDFLKTWGDLSSNQRYEGSARSGYQVIPGAGEQKAVKRAPLDLKTILDPAVMIALIIDEYPEFSPTMFQPVNGMDQIPKALQKRLKKPVQFAAEVQSIETGEQGASVVWRHTKTGKTERLTADYVVSSLPLPLLAKISNNLGSAVNQALATIQLGHANKVAWQAPRFWETHDQIYGGLSFLKHETYSFWYPSNHFQSPEGILVGAYNNGEVARLFAQKNAQQQIQSSRLAVELVHPGFGKTLKNPIAVAWDKIPYSLGPWIEGEPAEAVYQLLNQPQGRVYITSDGLARKGIGIWQESAVVAARRQVQQVVSHALAKSTGTSQQPTSKVA